MSNSIRKMVGIVASGVVALSMSSCMSTRAPETVGNWQGQGTDGGSSVKIAVMKNGDVIIDGKHWTTWRPVAGGIEFTSPGDGKTIIVGTVTPTGELMLKGQDGRVLTLERGK